MVEQGDHNTSIFHNMANTRRRFSHIDKLDMNGTITEDRDVIAHQILPLY